MERRILRPEHIIVPGEYELGNESILKIYFRVFNRGHGEDLPPVIVTHYSQGDQLKRFDNPSNKKIVGAYRQKLDDFVKNGAEYFLLDGNHKAVAAALTHNPILALELQAEGDILEIQRMVERGDLFDWNHESQSLVEIANQFEDYTSEYLDKMKTVEERVRLLTSNGDLPQYIKERYLRGK